MPKVISRSVVSSNQGEDRAAPLYVYHCNCGQLALIMNVKMEKLARRKEDNSRVINSDHTLAKLHYVNGDTKFIKRSAGIEKQYRLNCKNCALPLFYRGTDQDTKITHIMDGALIKILEEEKSVVKLDVDDSKMDLGRQGTVTVSTADEEEAELESIDVQKSYEINAAIIAREMVKKEFAKKRALEAEEQAAKRKKGTLLSS
eukprot:Colp12_sorted_trinity150504_noHs@15908